MLGQSSSHNSRNLRSDENDLSLSRDPVASLHTPSSPPTCDAGRSNAVGTTDLAASLLGLNAPPNRPSATADDLALWGQSRGLHHSAERLWRHKGLKDLSSPNQCDSWGP
jgi:hypothetical protein